MNSKISLPPRPAANKPLAQPTEAEIEAMINKGGKPVETNPADDVDPETIRHVNTRLTEGIIRQIDTLRSRRPRKMGSPKMGVSLRDWIVEAVLEKLERERGEK